MQMESDKINDVLKAKIAARKSFKKLEKGGSNPHFKSKYSTLDDIWNACGGALAENGLDVTHQILNNGNGTEIVATLFHESGQYLRSAIPLPIGTPQQTGSAITYMRRYTIQSILGLEGDSFTDDDGNAAEEIKEKKTTDPSWVGPLAKNKLVDAARAIGRDVSACEDLDSLIALEISKETVGITSQLEKDLPHYWDHEPEPEDETKNYNGLSQQFTKRKEELTNGIN